VDMTECGNPAYISKMLFLKLGGEDVSDLTSDEGSWGLAEMREAEPRGFCLSGDASPSLIGLRNEMPERPRPERRVDTSLMHHSHSLNAELPHSSMLSLNAPSGRPLSDITQHNYGGGDE
jgi:hypothetical protein